MKSRRVPMLLTAAVGFALGLGTMLLVDKVHPVLATEPLLHCTTHAVACWAVDEQITECRCAK